MGIKMKKSIRRLLIGISLMMIVCIMMTMTGCNVPFIGGTDGQSDDGSADVIEMTDDDTGYDVSNEELVQLANERVEEQYNFLYGFLAGAYFDFDENGSAIEGEDGSAWYPIDADDASSEEDLDRAWEENGFSTSVLTSDLLEHYAIEDGTIYSDCGGIGDDLTFGGIQIDSVEVRQDADNAVLTGTIHRIDPNDESAAWDEDFEYSLTREDGEWLCTGFSMYF